MRFDAAGAPPPEVRLPRGGGVLAADRGCKKLKVASSGKKEQPKADAGAGKKGYVPPVPGLAQSMAQARPNEKPTKASVKGKGLFDGGIAAARQEREERKANGGRKGSARRNESQGNNPLNNLPAPLRKGFSAVGDAFGSLFSTLGKLTDPQQVSRSLGLSRPA